MNEQTAMVQFNAMLPNIPKMPLTSDYAFSIGVIATCTWHILHIISPWFPHYHATDIGF
jgi:hypothetical protein